MSDHDAQLEPRPDDAESVVVQADSHAMAVDPPDEPRTVYGTVMGARNHERAPIMPAWTRSKSERRQYAEWALDYAWYSVRFHAHRFVTKYLWLGMFWAVVGVFRVAGKQLRWWWLLEQHGLRQNAASRNDADTWHKLHSHARDVRKSRGLVLAAEVLAIVIVVTLLVTKAPTWMKVAALAAAMPPLARMGRPEDKPILDRVTLGQRFVKLTAEQVRSALCAMGISAIKEPSQLSFPPPGIHRDGPGWLARVNLPLGVEAVEVLEKRGKLASALRLPVDQVWPSVGPDHPGQMDLWVGYQPASKMGQPRWSLVSPTARTSVFDEHEFGTDERQRPVKTSLFARNVLLGGQPGSGKSYGAMTFAWIASLDPICELKIAEHKGVGDFLDFAELCTTYICGVDDQALDASVALIHWGLAEAERRGKRLEKAKKRGEAPEGKVTPELAARPGSGLHPVLIIIDEAHEVFLHDKTAGAAAERLVKRGRALGLIVVIATQIPDAKSVPPNLTRCVTLRWCMAVGDYQANDAILGTGMYKKGQTATPYRPGLDAGWGIFAGLASDGPVRSHFPTEEERAVMLARAKELRGDKPVGAQADAQQRRDILNDVATIFVRSERGAHWETIAERLAALDDAYDGVTAEIVSARLRSLGVASVDVKIDSLVRKGARVDAIAEAIDKRALTGAPR